ncbi:DNA-binding FadR family transcriptional regulator [Azospirillum agricola]|uniref:FadR/GntR family transcriptional regulator n=1 Tax=Azospirillum agricola TaxID=1720247 RepID=UPI001AE6219D|nr:FadR/GntR family transcriptional regulator [Azospirillum agricola]MBP2230985.1 DNA-binding FadR family transcriptional regulator [Azospirillum agricola]
MPVEFENVVTTSAAKQIADTLRAAIMDGRLQEDERLPTEEELAQRFKVSRPTVREALKRLAAQHLIRSRRGPTGGNFVASPAPEDAALSLANATTLMVAAGAIQLDDMATARLELEGICCRLAATARTDAQLEAMRAELARQRDVSLTDEEFCASDVRFHRALVDAAGNSLLSFLMHAVVEALQPVSNMIIFRVRERQAIVAFHERILGALESRDAEAGVAALGDLVAYTRDRYRDALDRRAERAG